MPNIPQSKDIPGVPTVAPQVQVTDMRRLELAALLLEEALVKWPRIMTPEAKARAISLAYKLLEGEDKEKDLVSFEYAQKMIAKLIKTVD